MGRWEELKSPPELEAEVLSFWKDKKIFEQSLAESATRPGFVFYEGPPTANGLPHNGHVLTRVVKDLLPRYKTMRGYRVERKAGWDTHGLPVEVEVEKELGIHGREEIERYGVEPFTKRCIESVFRYTSEWEELTTRVGFWVDLGDAYVTYHRSYVESVWWALSQLFKKGLLYQGHKVVWWWPQGGTALSSAEVGEGYRAVDDPAATVRFRLTADSAARLGCTQNTSLLAWTTTPWTLPSNVALAVNAHEDYVLMAHQDEVLILAAALQAQVPGTVLRTIKGVELQGLHYEPLYRFEGLEPSPGKMWTIVTGAHVTLDTGTGIVHTAPAFGEDDFRTMKEQGLGFLQLVGPDGKFIKGTTWLEGRFCKEADKDITRDLKERGLLFKNESYRHDYPFCPRADKDPLIQYARPAWFIRTTDYKAEALQNNSQVRWHPETIQNGRFGDFLRNNVDWALSRERFWGTPLNIWECSACQHRHAPASCAEIEAMGGKFAEGISPDLQVHKPWIDKVTLNCPACGAQMQRVSEVIDCWFDSGCMPFAQFGFPHKGHDAFQRSFPADFISEAIDQTRGWFYSLLMISTLVFDDATRKQFGLTDTAYPRPYKSCIVLGHVCDADGKKESKSKGNYTSPDLVLKGYMKVKVVADSTLKPGQLGMKGPQVKSLGLDPSERMRIETAQGNLSLEVVPCDIKGKDTVGLNVEDIKAYQLGEVVEIKAPFAAPGADAFRWLFYASNPPWTNTRISLKAILEGQREFLLRLKNVHQFYILNSENHIPETPQGKHLLDKWILHELEGLVSKCTEHLDNFQIYEAARALNAFVEGLSTWYLRRSRDRFDDPGQDGKDVRDTLYTVLLTLSKLIAPFVPFQAEALWRSLKQEGPESVHLCAWPQPDASRMAPALAQQMALIRELASLGLSARANVGVRVRQPLSAIEVILAQPDQAEGLAPLLALLQEELNVRQVRFSTEPERFVSFKVKPDFKVLGKKLGKDMKACQSALAGMEGALVRRQVLGGGLRLELPNGPTILGPEEIVVAVEAKAGFQAAGSATAVVALHAALDEDLLEEGLWREVASRIQAIRKQLGLRYADPVQICLAGGGRTERMLARFSSALCAATGSQYQENLAVEPVCFSLDGEEVSLWVARA